MEYLDKGYLNRLLVSCDRVYGGHNGTLVGINKYDITALNKTGFLGSISIKELSAGCRRPIDVDIVKEIWEYNDWYGTIVFIRTRDKATDHAFIVGNGEAVNVGTYTCCGRVYPSIFESYRTGKTYINNKSWRSVTVIDRNKERKVYSLRRPYYLKAKFEGVENEGEISGFGIYKRDFGYGEKREYLVYEGYVDIWWENKKIDYIGVASSSYPIDKEECLFSMKDIKSRKVEWFHTRHRGFDELKRIK